VSESESSLLRRRNKRWNREDRQTEALRRMEIDGAALAKMPPITEILDEAGISKSEVIKAMRFSDDDLIDKFFYTYDALPLKDRESVPLEALILKAGVNPTHFLGSIQLAIRENAMNRTKMIAMANHPKIMEKTVEFAQIAGGYRDREHLYTMTGALPTPKGISIFQKFTNTSPTLDSKAQEPVQEAEILETDANYIFPDSSRMQDKLTPIRQKQLGSGE
jgi:hypothetical protein